MKIIGIDTSTPIASVALVEDGVLVLEEVHTALSGQQNESQHPKRANHAATVIPLLDSLLRESQISLTDVSALSVAIGPGSFTGLRIGLSTVLGLAFGWNIPVVGIRTLPAIATRAVAWTGIVCPILDARKSEVYTALFRKNKNGSLQRLTDDIVCPPEKILYAITSYSGEPCLLIGSGTQVYREIIESILAGVDHSTKLEIRPSIAFGVARLGEERALKQKFDSPGMLTPLYLRPSEAELKKAKEVI